MQKKSGSGRNSGNVSSASKDQPQEDHQTPVFRGMDLAGEYAITIPPEPAKVEHSDISV